MNYLYKMEQACKSLRHSKALRRAAPLWSFMRPAYNAVLKMAAKQGLQRNINGTDLIKVVPELRVVPEIYEPQVWALLMQKATPGSRIIDVGAHVGLYAVAFANRVKPDGVVLAAEPDPENIILLNRQVSLNGVQSIVRIVPAALSEGVGTATLATRGTESRVTESVSWSNSSTAVKVTTLDEVTKDSKWDMLLIDVEGFEEKVLRGGRSLLSDPVRRPHTILIEVHPYVWNEMGVSSSSLLEVLHDHGYVVHFIDGSPVTSISIYGHIVASAPVTR